MRTLISKDAVAVIFALPNTFRNSTRKVSVAVPIKRTSAGVRVSWVIEPTEQSHKVIPIADTEYCVLNNMKPMHTAQECESSVLHPSPFLGSIFRNNTKCQLQYLAKHSKATWRNTTSTKQEKKAAGVQPLTMSCAIAYVPTFN